MKNLVAELVAWKTSLCTVEMSYMTACICGGNRRFPTIKNALAHLSEVALANDILFSYEEDYPKDWPRWQVRSDRYGNWNWSRGRIMRRMGIETS